MCIKVPHHSVCLFAFLSKGVMLSAHSDRAGLIRLCWEVAKFFAPKTLQRHIADQSTANFCIKSGSDPVL